MSNFSTIFPLPLVLATIIFIIFPTFLAAVLRFYIYQHFRKLINKVARHTKETANKFNSDEKEITDYINWKKEKTNLNIIERLEIEYYEASLNLENVNSVALIDRLYSQERIKLWGFFLSFEQWDSFCRTLPSLLLGFGLLGTFIGISVNLYSLSQTLNQSSAEVGDLVEQLQTPLQSMGVAFLSSLIAILCSSILIVFNLRYNTNFAKAFLFSSLESYLDNVFKIKIKGYNRLDKAVDRMVDKQEEFLLRFRENVQQVLEDSFGKAANQIVKANQGFQNNVDLLVNKFSDVSGTMANSTDSFQGAVYKLEKQIATVEKIVPQFQQSSDKLKTSSDRYLQASVKIEQSKFSEHIENFTADLATTQKNFSLSTNSLQQYVEQLANNSEQSNKIAQSFYTEIKQASIVIQESSTNFNQAANILDNTDFANKLADTTKELITVPQQFKESTAILHKSTDNISSAIDSISKSSEQVSSLIEKVNSLNENSVNSLEKSDLNIKEQTNQLKTLIIQLQKQKEAINKSIEKFGEKVLNSFQTESQKNIEQMQNLTQQFNSGVSEIGVISYRNSQEETNQIKQTRVELQAIVKELKKQQKAINNSIENFGGRILKTFQTESNNNIQEIQKLIQQFNSGLSGIGMISDRLIDKVDRQTTANAKENINTVKELKEITIKLNNIASKIEQVTNKKR